MDLDTFLVSLYVLADEWWQEKRAASRRKPGHPPLLSPSEVLTLAILSQWPAFVASGTSSASSSLTFVPPSLTPSPPASSTAGSAPWSRSFAPCI